MKNTGIYAVQDQYRKSVKDKRFIKALIAFLGLIMMAGWIGGGCK